jgi:DNA mismatch repair ATPase MutS
MSTSLNGNMLLLPLCCSLLQLGSWVPATSCRLSVFDGVFSRMGASDCLLAGRSTFAEELGDASHILSTATNRWGGKLGCFYSAGWLT